VRSGSSSSEIKPTWTIALGRRCDLFVSVSKAPGQIYIFWKA
jgi:hypothetical protein